MKSLVEQLNDHNKILYLKERIVDSEKLKNRLKELEGKFDEVGKKRGEFLNAAAQLEQELFRLQGEYRGVQALLPQEGDVGEKKSS